MTVGAYRAHDEGYWNAFGRVVLKGDFKANTIFCADDGGYYMAYGAHYTVLNLWIMVERPMLLQTCVQYDGSSPFSVQGLQRPCISLKLGPTMA